MMSRGGGRREPAPDSETILQNNVGGGRDAPVIPTTVGVTPRISVGSKGH